MRKLVLSILLVFAPLLCFAKHHQPAHRIISLAPNVTEILYQAGAGASLVGVSAYSDYPLAAKKLPIVSSATGLDLEKIISLKPDLVVAWRGGTPAFQVATLIQHHIPVYWASTQTMKEIAQSIKHLGKLAGHKKEAARRAKQFLEHYQTLKKQYKHRKTMRVFYQMSENPLYTINRHSITNQLIDDCGGQNIFADTIGAAPQVTMSAVLAKQPQVIIISKPERDIVDLSTGWSKWQDIPAVKRHNVFQINSSLIDRPGPRLIQGMTQLCQDIQIARAKREL